MMATMTFRFTTECEMTLSGETQQEVYLKFKDFLHGNKAIQREACLDVCPPETDQMFFKTDQQSELVEIPHFKGAYAQDIFAREASH
jgi:hypothetical protein